MLCGEVKELAHLNQMQARDARLKRLAESIDSLAEHDRRTEEHAREISALRHHAAAQLHSICADFVASLNRFLSQSEVALDPAQFAEDAFRLDDVNLIQISVRGRILHIEFTATTELVSTEDFRIPYTISGSIRSFNQDLLQNDRVEEQLIFYTLEKEKRMWRFFDARTYRSGPLDMEYLVTLMEQLL